ncbi:Malate synthase OS=Lysinibacillus sphaericus OX=1421 GN=LS41612_22200 PE=3 SV=1 [Lysinibacillus sphaericus]
MEQATTGKLKIVGQQNEQTKEVLTPETVSVCSCPA